MSEEARAAQYRNDQIARRLFRRGLLEKLRGNHAARVALSNDWRPLAQALRDARRNPHGEKEPEDVIGNA